MCGIAGMVNWQQGAPAQAELDLAAERLAHRGPDDSGTWAEGAAGLAHRRLSILDLSPAGHQPFLSASGRYAMVYNGEVYNHRQLARDHGLQPTSGTDTEVVLLLFEQLGAAAFSRLHGMFALAIWDRHTHELWLARDRMGIKPLFYFQHLQTVAFGSELKALLAFHRVADQVSRRPESITQYLQLGYVPEPHTVYRQVWKMPAGHYARATADGLQLHRYWHLEGQVRREAITSEAAALEQLEALAQQAVKDRLMADVPLGTFLSGGTDSSLVTALAVQASAEPVRTFTIGFDSAQHNEAEHARAVAAHLGTHHQEWQLHEDDAADLVAELPGVYQEPYANSSALPSMLLCRLAKEHISVALAGDGGDETHLGYGMYRWARRLHNPALRAAQPLFTALGGRYGRIGEVLKRPHPFERQPHIYSQEEYYFSAAEAVRLAGHEEALLNWPAALQLDRRLDPAEAQALFDLRYYLRDSLLVKMDRASMAHGLEVRVPLLDHRLVQLALNISPDLRWQGKTMKALLKKLLAKHVPPSITDRPKWGFSVPLHQWLSGRWHSHLQEVLSADQVKAAGLVDPDQVHSTLAAWQGGKTYYYNRVWQLYALHLWANAWKP